MKVLDLQCTLAHVFEGWFASEDDFQHQLARGLVECPLCSDQKIAKRLSAPRINLGVSKPLGRGSVAPHHTTRGPPGAGVSSTSSTSPSTAQPSWLQAARELYASAEDVGDRFAQEARLIHHGDAQERAIRGHASARDALELVRDGVIVVPVPPALTETLQ